MSRGLGRAQRAIVEALEHRGGAWRASRLLGAKNRRRAIAALVARGVVRVVAGVDGVVRVELVARVSEELSPSNAAVSSPVRRRVTHAHNTMSTGEHVTVRLPAATVATVDALAAKFTANGAAHTRSAALRFALEIGLRALRDELSLDVPAHAQPEEAA